MTKLGDFYGIGYVNTKKNLGHDWSNLSGRKKLVTLLLFCQKLRPIGNDWEIDKKKFFSTNRPQC